MVLYFGRVYTVREREGEKGTFHLGQEKSREAREACNGQGKVIFYAVGQGKIPFFLSSGKHLIFSVYIQGLFSSKFYL